jgi:hypothetical protein
LELEGGLSGSSSGLVVQVVVGKNGEQMKVGESLGSSGQNG